MNLQTVAANKLGDPRVHFTLTARQAQILEEASRATGLTIGSLIRKCIDLNVEYLRTITQKVDE